MSASTSPNRGYRYLDDGVIAGDRQAVAHALNLNDGTRSSSWFTYQSS